MSANRWKVKGHFCCAICERHYRIRTKKDQAYIVPAKLILSDWYFKLPVLKAIMEKPKALNKFKKTPKNFTLKSKTEPYKIIIICGGCCILISLKNPKVKEALLYSRNALNDRYRKDTPVA